MQNLCAGLDIVLYHLHLRIFFKNEFNTHPIELRGNENYVQLGCSKDNEEAGHFRLAR